MRSSFVGRVVALVVLVAIGGLVVALLGIGGGGDDDRNPPEEGTSGPADEAGLDEQWSVELAPVGADAAVRRTEETVAFFSAGAAVGLDRATGDQRWRLELPRCAVSEATDAGIAVVAGGNGCGRLVAVDLDSGQELWRTTLGTQAAPGGDAPVLGVGDRVVTVGGTCGRVQRLSLADGSRLATPQAPRVESCENALVTTDGHTVLVHWEPEEPVGRLAVLDADSGRLLWQRRDSSLGTGQQVVASDPLTLTLEEHGGSVATRRYDPATGRPGRVLIRGGYGIDVLDVVDGTLLGTTQSAEPYNVVRALDLSSGRARWERQLDTYDSILGTGEDGVLIGTTDDGLASGVDDSPHLTLTRLGAQDGAAELLGRLPLAAVRPESLRVSGDFLGQVDEAGVLTSYALPAPGEGEPVDEDAGASPTPDDVIDACGTVRPETLRMLGLRAPNPAPYDCEWHEFLGEGEQRLEVQVHAGRDVSYQTAAEDTRRWVELTRRSFVDAVYAPTFVTTPEATPIRGWGDEAWVSQAFSPNGTDSYTGVVVRFGSLGVTAQAHTEAPFSGPGQRVTGYELQRGVRAALTDVLGGLGIGEGPGRVGDDGPVTSVPDVCAALDAPARAVVGEVATTSPVPARDPLRRVGACEWGDALSVVAYAVPGSVFDTATGTDLAKAAYDDACLVRDERVNGVGDAACRSDYADDGGRYRSATLVVRSGNLLLSVDYSRDDSPSADDVAAQAFGLGRAAVAGLRSGRAR